MVFLDKLYRSISHEAGTRFGISSALISKTLPMFGTSSCMGDESFKDRLCTRRKGTCCQLNDNEARAIHKIIIDMKLIEDEILQEWISAIWSHHVMGNSLREIAQSNDTSVNQIRQDLKCGLAYIKSRNPHFSFETFEKTA